MFFKHALVQTKWLLYKWLNRRSQKRSYTSDTFFNGLLRTFPLLEPSIKVSLFSINHNIVFDYLFITS